MKPFLKALVFALLFLIAFTAASAQTGGELYKQVRSFGLTGAKKDVQALTLKRDRVEMSFTGTFYFPAPINGKVYGAVFIGDGTFKCPAPQTPFERANLKRLTGAEDAVDSDFKTAVMRFTDDTMDAIGSGLTEGAVPSQAQSLANEVDKKILKETGANLSSRIVTSVLNNESPGFFFGMYDGGRKNRFSFVLDHQKRLPTDYFNINAGESGMIFKYKADDFDNDVWLAFYPLEDYARGTGTYSDVYDLVDIDHYEMDIDLTKPSKRLGLKTRMRMQVRVPDLQAVTFTINESLSEYDDQRLHKQMHLRSASMGGQALEWEQEDWEGGFTVIFPSKIADREMIDLNLEFEGDFLRQPSFPPDCSYPASNEGWYPHHGYLDRSTYDFTYHHSKKLKVASTGKRISEEPDPADKDKVVTKYVMTYPVAFQTFALGPWERHTNNIKWESGDPPTPLEFNSVSGNDVALSEKFMMAELDNAIRNFQHMFGRYPYDSFGAVFHPYGFGQGFATMLTIPNTDRATKFTYSFLAHETAHQWWGNIVAWRSYRDQWLSEGFAEYSGVVYTGLRDKTASRLINEMRQSLKDPPYTSLGPGKGRLNDVGPLILGTRLESRKTHGAYSALVYNKGGLVLRMIHFLLTDPSSGNGDAFFDMMKDFVSRYRDKVASTDDFRRVANEHFARSPLGRRYQLNNLDWFFQQWVYQTDLPTYKLEYQVANNPDGTATVSGTVFQGKVPESWFMPLPIVFKFSGDKYAYGTVVAKGAKMPFQIKLPMAPTSVELDPKRWILSENTTTN